MKDFEGNDIKIRGKKNLTTYFREHPEQWKRLYDMCYEKLTIKEDPYIKSFEELLDINMSDVIGVDIESTNIEEI